MFVSINNETQCAPLLYLSSRFTTYTPSFNLGKLSLEKTPLNLGSLLKINMDHVSLVFVPSVFFDFPVNFICGIAFGSDNQLKLVYNDF